MSERFTIEIHPRDAHHAKLISEMTNISVEDVISTKLQMSASFIMEGIKSNTRSFSYYTDVELWWITVQPYHVTSSKRMNHLTQKAKSGIALTDEEIAEHDYLLDDYNMRVLIRSEALVILKERGFDLQWFFKRQILFDTEAL